MNTTQTREAWLAERRTGVGSSDAAPALGMSPWRTAYELYLDKIGEAHEREQTPQMEVGTLMEPVVAELYQRRTGRTLQAAPPILRHPERPWQFASVDRLVVDNGRVVELKTAGPYQVDEWGEPGTDQVPAHYLLQVTHQLVVTKTEIADLAVLLAGQEFRLYTIALNPTLAELLTEREAKFWECVQRRTPPDPDWEHDSTPAIFKAMRGVSALEVALGEDVAGDLAEYQSLGERILAAEKAREVAKAKIFYALGKATCGRLPDHTLLERKVITTKEHVVKEHTYQKLQISKPKLKKARHT